MTIFLARTLTSDSAETGEYTTLRGTYVLELVPRPPPTKNTPKKRKPNAGVAKVARYVPT